MATWAWTTQQGTFLIKAETEDEATRRVISARIRQGNTDAKEAIAWFRKDDTLTEVIGYVTYDPFAGDVPDDDDQ